MPKEYKVEINSRICSATSVKAEGLKAGMGRKKGWFKRIRVGMVPWQARPGAFVLIEMFMERVGFGNWYSEKIIDPATGKILHHCEEPLSQHKGHGSAKLKDAKPSSETP